ncbi:unnamed protein product, partial [Didymodactylos carnosus]
AFIPHPAIRVGGRAGDSITHTEITQIGFLRSLTKYFKDHIDDATKIDLSKSYTINDLYKLYYNVNDKEAQKYTTPIKSVIDVILVENALVDFNNATKKLPAAHFDSEAFINGSRRILTIRKLIIDDVKEKKEYKEARKYIGQLLHTLQDFYSHSNWLELGKTVINDKLGVELIIGQVASPNQSTCTNEGCLKTKVRCGPYQKLTLNKCPLIYFDCINNIRQEIITQGLLTSGFSINQFNEFGQAIFKPKNVEKCSHGGVLDTSSYVNAVGGINKDTVSAIYSPHHYLHYDAADLATNQTEKFFNDLRRDLGDQDYAELFDIHPSKSKMIVQGFVDKFRKYHFFTNSVSSGMSFGHNLYLNFKNSIKNRFSKIKKLFGRQTEVPDYKTGAEDSNGDLKPGDKDDVHTGILMKRLFHIDQDLSSNKNVHQQDLIHRKRIIEVLRQTYDR